MRENLRDNEAITHLGLQALHYKKIPKGPQRPFGDSRK